jgi:hypothetical protein
MLLNRKSFSVACGSAVCVVLSGVVSAEAAGQIYYGSRAGMTVTIKSMFGLGSSRAVIMTEHTRDDAAGFCRDYVGENPVTEKCIKQELSVPLNDVVHADCPAGIFTNFFGEKYQFRGKNPHPGDVGPRYLLMALRNREIADGSSASGYDVNMDIFRALCPRIAPPAESTSDASKMPSDIIPLGWVYYPYLKCPMRSVGRDCNVADPTSTPLNIRSMPGSKAAIVGTIDNGLDVRILDDEGDWAFIGLELTQPGEKFCAVINTDLGTIRCRGE